MSNCDPLKVFIFVFPLFLLDVTDTYRELSVLGDDQSVYIKEHSET